jgi:hypothetical protein
VPIVLKSGSLKLLKLSGPVKASNGVTLLLLVYAGCKAKHGGGAQLLFTFPHYHGKQKITDNWNKTRL